LIQEIRPAVGQFRGSRTRSIPTLSLSRDELCHWIHTAVSLIQRAFHWTQEDLGHAFGVSQPTFSRWYTAWTEGWRMPTEDELRKLKELPFRACGELLGFQNLVYRKSYPPDCSCEPPDLPEALFTALYPKGDALPARGPYFVDLHVRSAD